MHTIDEELHEEIIPVSADDRPQSIDDEQSGDSGFDELGELRFAEPDH